MRNESLPKKVRYRKNEKKNPKIKPAKNRIEELGWRVGGRCNFGDVKRERLRRHGNSSQLLISLCWTHSPSHPAVLRKNVQ